MPREYASHVERPMWTCPTCGRQFLNAKGWHSCLPSEALEDVMAGKPPGLADAYRKLEAMATEIGPIRVEVLKSRIAFKARTLRSPVQPSRSRRCEPALSWRAASTTRG